MRKQTARFLSCQWNADIFKLQLVEQETLATIIEIRSNLGISTVFRQWQKQNGCDRISYYLNVIGAAIKRIEQKTQANLDNTPVIISGIASSHEGIIDMKCKSLSIVADGSNLKIKKIKAKKNFLHDVYIIAGKYEKISLTHGQETQIVGCSDEKQENRIVILTGPEAKHAFVLDNEICEVKSYATGKIFERITNKRFFYPYANSIDIPALEDGLHEFHRGLLTSHNINFLQAISLTSGDNFIKLSTERQNYYLSGLLIGMELQDLVNVHMPITLVSNNIIEPLYICAINYFGIEPNLKILSQDEALIRGHNKVYNRLIKVN